MSMLRFLCRMRFMRRVLARVFSPRSNKLSFERWGLRFRNRVGLGAGFDKNARYLRELDVLGFGFVEIGTITPLPQAGNPRPRLFRLPQDRALINRMGFNNDGAEAVAERLRMFREKFRDSEMLIGGNIGKNKGTPNEYAWRDYRACFEALHPFVDFFVVNVSSPNTPGLRDLQEKDSLRQILARLIMGKEHPKRPLFLKIAPDLTEPQLDDVITLSMDLGLDGIVATNTTTGREGLKTSVKKLQQIGSGGLSGRPLRPLSTQIVKYIHEKTAGQMPIIASGGIFHARDAREKLEAGASLIEVWTAFIYEGPSIVKRICSEKSR